MTESVILVAGAANAPSLEELAIETARQVLFLTLPSVEEKENKIFSEVMEKFPGHRAIFLSQCDTTGKTIRARSLPLASVIGEGKTIADEFRKDDTALLLRGAITDNVLEYLLSDSAFVDMTLVAEDGRDFSQRQGGATAETAIGRICRPVGLVTSAHLRQPDASRRDDRRT